MFSDVEVEAEVEVEVEVEVWCLGSRQQYDPGFGKRRNRNSDTRIDAIQTRRIAYKSSVRLARRTGDRLPMVLFQISLHHALLRVESYSARVVVSSLAPALLHWKPVLQPFVAILQL